MLKIQEIRELIRLIDSSNIEELVYEVDGTKIQLKKPVRGVTAQPTTMLDTNYDYQNVDAVQPAVVHNVVQEVAPKEEVNPPQAAEVDKSNLHKITSPMVGTFYAAPSPDKPNYAAVGDKVKEDSIVCIVEAMKLFNEIEAEVNGEIVEILVENGQLVEYGQPLFLVKPL